MTIEELNDKHFSIASGEGWENNPFEDEHTNLSIQFAIEILEELNQTWVGDSKMIYADAVQNKVQELKKILK